MTVNLALKFKDLLRGAVRYGIPPLVSLAVFWRVPFTWFRVDDFAWLGLPIEVTGANSLLRVLFEPQAQGTIRVLSERLFFLVLGGLFGLHSWPFRIVAFATWCLILFLIQKIGTKLTGSSNAGFVAALLWSVSAVVTAPLAWASAYNELMCGALILGAFYARLLWLETGKAKWRWVEAVAYLAGFGALEVIVVYPAVVVLHAMTDERAREQWKSALWMYLPAGLFAAAHFFLIPKDPGPTYALIIDGRLPLNFFRYLGWAIGPSDEPGMGPQWIALGMMATWAIGIGLLVFFVSRVIKKEWSALFFVGWFALFIAPVVAIPNHVYSYYATIPGIGMAWLGGWALATCWKMSKSSSGVAMAMVANVFAAAYFVGSIVEVRAMTTWHLRVTSRLRIVMRAAEQVAAKHPGTALAMQGVDDEMFRGGFRDDPFRLVGIKDVYLVPGDADEILKLPEFQGETSQRFKTSREELLPLLQGDKVRVLNVASNTAIDVTAPYRKVLETQFLAGGHSRVELGNPVFTSRLGSGWFAPENGARWMGKTATVTLSGPKKAGERLYVDGYAVPEAIGTKGLVLTASAGGTSLGSAKIVKGGEPFAFDFALPEGVREAQAMQVTLGVDRTFRVANDERELGIVIRKVEVR